MGIKMKGRALVILLLLNFTSFLALNAQWAKTYGGSGKDIPRSIVQINDGGYIVAGSTGSFGSANGDFWILKFVILCSLQPWLPSLLASPCAFLLSCFAFLTTQYQLVHRKICDAMHLPLHKL